MYFCRYPDIPLDTCTLHTCMSSQMFLKISPRFECFLTAFLWTFEHDLSVWGAYLSRDLCAFLFFPPDTLHTCVSTHMFLQISRRFERFLAAFLRTFVRFLPSMDADMWFQTVTRGKRLPTSLVVTLEWPHSCVRSLVYLEIIKRFLFNIVYSYIW